jgi:hypothetical protein
MFTVAEYCSTTQIIVDTPFIFFHFGPQTFILDDFILIEGQLLLVS